MFVVRSSRKRPAGKAIFPGFFRTSSLSRNCPPIRVDFGVKWKTRRNPEPSGGFRPEPLSRYRRVLRISLPLVVSMATTMILEVTDRIFLAHYSLDAIAAATPGGLTAFLFIAFFMGVGSYVNVFVAQYTGAGSMHRVGSALWQGVYFAVFAGAALSALSFVAVPLFDLVGHGEAIRRLEVSYFRILCLGGGFCVLEATLACFFSGRGLTRPVMLIHLAGMLLNIPLNYALINGRWIFPEMGIAGAGLGNGRLLGRHRASVHSA